MSQFGHIKALHVKEGDTAEFVFEELEGYPSLTCLPATNINKPFFNAVLKAPKEVARKVTKRKKGELPTEAEIEKARLEDIDLFVEFIVTGWDDVLNSDGDEVEFSEDACREFLQAIPPEMFNKLRLFCLDIRNFRPDVRSMTSEELDGLLGN